MSGNQNPPVYAMSLREAAIAVIAGIRYQIDTETGPCYAVPVGLMKALREAMLAEERK